MTFDPYLAEAQVQEARQGGKVEIKPSAAQRAWLSLRFGMFIHFGINTFNDAEWSDGTLDPATFNPRAFDADQWCAAAAAAGVRYLLVVTKHHDGFCLWPSRWTEYTVAHSPFRQDVIGLVVDSARKYGLKVGLYYSLWDRHEPSYDHDHGYAIYMKRQLAELLTRYGEIVEVWFDGGWKKGGVHYQDPDRWHWREMYEHIKAIQPDCLVANNGTSGRSGEIIMWPCDFRIGERKPPREDDNKIWYCGGIGDYLPYETCNTLSAGGSGKGMFAGGKWFWHADDHTVRDAQWVVDSLTVCTERGANFVINAAPADTGLLRDIDVACLQQVGKLRSASPASG
jgi:alpha-L-fucosidase